MKLREIVKIELTWSKLRNNIIGMYIAIETTCHLAKKVDLE